MATEQKSTRSELCGRLGEAEGLIELITGPARQLGLSPLLRRRLAARALRAAFLASPPREQAWQRDLLIGQALRLSRRYRRALGPLLAAARRNPQSRSAWIALGWCLKRQGQIDRAASVLAQAVNRIPDDAVLHFNLACYLALLGQGEMAVSQLLWALDLEPALKSRLRSEKDFDPIRGTASFRAISDGQNRR
jgi:tetratricopeptide (TPR) repeat protein